MALGLRSVQSAKSRSRRAFSSILPSGMADSADDLIKRARAFEERGDWKMATSILVRLARSFPMSGEPHHNLARALRISGRHTEALAAARDAARLLPKHATVRNSLGLSYENVGR